MKVTRRTILAGAAGAVVAGSRTSAQSPQVPADPTKVRGRPASALGERSPFEAPKRLPRSATGAFTPHQDLLGTITPSDLHFERHHGGVPDIDPERYSLLDPRHGRAPDGLHAGRPEALSAASPHLLPRVLGQPRTARRRPRRRRSSSPD